jgi:hypothetical protein
MTTPRTANDLLHNVHRTAIFQTRINSRMLSRFHAIRRPSAISDLFDFGHDDDHGD